MNLSQALITGENLSLGEALSMGGQVTGLGLLIVFAVLIILMLVLCLFRVIFYKDPSKNAKTEVKPVEEEKPAAVPVQTNEADDEELIAVLTAAVAASLNTSTYNLRIKSYRRVNNNVPAWNKAGVNETISNKIF